MQGSEPGERRGGRKAGTPNKATAEVRELASKYGEDAIKAIAALAGLAEDKAGKAQNETAQLSALGTLVDRGPSKSHFRGHHMVTMNNLPSR